MVALRGLPGFATLFRSLRRDPGYAVPGAVAVATSVALTVAFLALVRFDGLALAPELIPEAASPAEWGLPPGEAAVAPVAIATGRLTGLMTIAGSITLLAAAAGLLTWTLLSLGRVARLGRERAVRRALGSNRRDLLAGAVLEAGLIVLPAAAVGTVLGSAGALAARVLWPGMVRPGVLLQAGEWLALGVMVLGAIGIRGILSVGSLSAPRLRESLAAGRRLTADRREVSVRKGLAIVQLAAALAILTGSGLLLLGSLPSTGGLVPSGGASVVTAHLVATDGADPDSVRRRTFYQTLLRSAAELTTVEAESIASLGAWQGLGREERVAAQCGNCWSGMMPMPLKAPVVRQHVVSPGFFRSLGVAVLSGRAFGEGDAASGPPVAVVSRSFALQSFENGDPLGKQVQVAGLEGPWVTVVGVVEDLAPPGLGRRGDPAPTLYLPALQHPPRDAGLALRFRDPPEGAQQALLESLVREAGGATGWEVREVRTLDSVLARYRAPLVWLAWLFLILGSAALFLAVHGIHAVSRYRIRAQLQELAVRMAVGASPRAVMRLVLGESARLVVWGGLLGAWAALFVGGTLQAFGLPMFDLSVTGGSLVLLALAALLGSVGPAREAGRGQPARALETP